MAQTAVDTGSYSDGEKFLNQNWSHDERLEYYYTSQGSAALHYGIFVALEQSDTQDLFRSDANLARFGFITQPADSKFNPDGLPVGVAKATVPGGRWKGEWAGLTCAACHNGQVAFKGANIRIAGGNNNKLDFYKFIGGLDGALHAALSDPAKFDRMTKRMRVQDTEGREEVRRLLIDDASSVRIYLERTSLTPNVAGPGRVDALALIHNQVTATQLGLPENWRQAMAPVKYSFVWNLPQSAWA